MRKKKFWAVALSLLLAASVTAGVTLATGEADTPESDPNFTVGLGASAASYRIIPGKTEELPLSVIAVTTDRDAWLYAATLDETTVGGVSYISYAIGNGWQPLLRDGDQVLRDDGSSVYYRAVLPTEDPVQYYPFFSGGSVTYPATLENEDLEEIPAGGLSLRLWTQATQQLGFGSALEAYDGLYTAQNYNITWQDEDGTELAVSTAAPGEVPSYSGVLYKAPDASYHYSFSAWTPAPVAAMSDATYTATYTGEAHSFGAWETTTPPSCTEAGEQACSCACGWTKTQPAAALGHNYGTPSYAWSEEGGAWHCMASTTCQRDSSHVLVENAQISVSEIQPVDDTPGERIYTATFTDAVFQTQTKTVPIPPAPVKFDTAFSNTDKYLYRVGNGNTVKLSSLFKLLDGMTVSDGNNVQISVEKADAMTNVALNTYTKNTNWQNATLKFTGEGPVRVTIQEKSGDTVLGRPYTLNLEIVNANNAVSAASATSANIVLLNDVNGGLSVSSSKRLYGNGFSVNDTRNNPSGTSGYVTLANAITDNVQFVGYEPESAVTDGVNNPGYAPAVLIPSTSGSVEMYHTYVSGGRNGLQVQNGDLYMYGCVLDGGAIANMELSKGDLTMEDCQTTTSTRGGLHGLSIRVTNTAGVSVNLKGSFEQHNWLQKSDIPSSYSGVFNSLFTGEYAYSYDGASYVNMGVMFLAGSGSIYQADAEAMISDSTGNTYGYIEKSLLGTTGTVYTAKGSMGSPEMIQGAVFEPYQYGVLPTTAFDFTTKNYIPNDGGDTYCYYDTTAGRVNISFEKGAATPYFEWDADILSATKFGNALGVTNVLSSGTAEKVNGKYRFAEDGDYVVTYSYTDPFNYDKDLSKGAKSYTKELKIHVSSIASAHPSFTYVSTWANAAKKVVVNNNTYVMPDVSATSANIGSTTVSGTMIYFPIVSIPATDSTGNTAYSSGKGYYFAPVFNALNITDYNQSTGAVQYTYNASSTTWPHGKATANGPDEAVFGYAAGAAYANKPYGRSMNAQYYKFGKNNQGLCYTSNEIEKDNAASTHLVQYHYVANDGITYLFYVQYQFGAMTYKASSCLATGTLITLADGSQKPIEEVGFNDKLMAWDFFTGESCESGVAILVFHGNEEYEVETLTFSDGTELRIIGDHGLFDYDENCFVYPVKDNYEQYIGHRFVKPGTVGYKLVTLDGVSFDTEYTGSWSITSAKTSNAVADGLLTVAPPQAFYNWIGMSGKLRYDAEQFTRDVEEYGLYDYSIFEPYVSREIYEAFNGAYLKIPVAKGVFTFDYVLSLIREYRQFMPEHATEKRADNRAALAQ